MVVSQLANIQSNSKLFRGLDMSQGMSVRLRSFLFMESTKKCNKCGVVKSLEGEFNKIKSGFRPICKTCYKKEQLLYSANDREKDRDYRRMRRKKNYDIIKTQEIKYRLKNRFRINAHNKVYYYLKKGIIKKQNCCVCGDINSKAHHEDYSKPLEVVWYCEIHHRARHNQINNEKRK